MQYSDYYGGRTGPSVSRQNIHLPSDSRLGTQRRMTMPERYLGFDGQRQQYPQQFPQQQMPAVGDQSDLSGYYATLQGAQGQRPAVGPSPQMQVAPPSFRKPQPWWMRRQQLPPASQIQQEPFATWSEGRFAPPVPNGNYLY